ncbi:NYN domain-containing protein [Macrococcus armenti]|uniref:NYN domain-containing protein n=1 Tax=Macrococcus armenti TaxID=2875764 RepID=A0ABY3ZX39_9STAP|nr:NYN domain-containing protein [Macrococcus armenti]UBH08515.1 NYN domain-containing protein [Macrococcus armenti]UBH10800.1 NYN domain-containing protein [Macrococcus armenti]UBH15281.1 NYN domain-containing protein [Macrococcus armenti]UBH17639.1 NYN domain-containing protein [Macrococcus armenti]UBH19906.1 NYN domain-containing protein [Macrococcus armenti]
MKQHYTIIDGYNVIGQSNYLKAMAIESLAEARTELLLELANYNARIEDDVIVVFDAYDVKSHEREEVFHGIRVIYSKENETADAVIERLTFELYNKHITTIKVVTSDMSEQHAIFGSGALRIPSREFISNLEEEKVMIEKDIKNMHEVKPRTRITIDEATLQKLERIRRGKL